jgi:hypothetical protein
MFSNFTNKESIGCSFKFLLKVGVEESIVNRPLVRLQNKKKHKQRKKWG